MFPGEITPANIQAKCRDGFIDILEHIEEGIVKLEDGCFTSNPVNVYIPMNFSYYYLFNRLMEIVQKE